MRVYLDNAATSWPKPDCVYGAIDRYQREVGAAAGRGSYREAAEAQRTVDSARSGCAALMGVAEASRVVFAANGTDALNLAIHGILQREDHVVATVCEHNSVLRPLAHLRELLGVETSFVPCDASGVVDPDDVGRAIRSDTRLVVASHASNVTGA
ncbi:MAG: aminotransferase class V-fold PLP-dependent enzyme, partial [Planctomycetota bacterium]